MPNPTDRLVRLYGPPAVERLHQARVLVIGVGGVGSAAAESLARSAVGHITLVDPDLVAESNLNRQLQATWDTLGQNKAEALAERLRRVAPSARIEAVAGKFDRSTAEPLLLRAHDFVVDAIDNLTDKCELIRYCRELELPLVVSLGAGGRTDPCRITLNDLARTRHCPMGAMVRKLLRQRHGFPRTGLFQIPAVYSEELPSLPHGELGSPGVAAVYSEELPSLPHGELGSSGVAALGACSEPNHELDSPTVIPLASSSPDHDHFTQGSPRRERLIRGTVSFVTGTFGFFCASVVVRRLLELPILELD